MLPVLFASLFIVAGCASASPLANHYIDSVLNVALPNEIRSLNLDPAVVPDFVTQFEDKVKIIGKVKGKAEFFKGSLTGLSQAIRYSECQGPYYSFGGKNINCTIGLNNLRVTYEGKMKYGKMPKVNIKGKANITATLIFIEISQNPPASPSTLKNFLFQQMGHMKMEFTGLGPLNRFLKALEDGFRDHVQAQIFNSMSQRYQYAVNRAVAGVPMPN